MRDVKVSGIVTHKNLVRSGSFYFILSDKLESIRVSCKADAYDQIELNKRYTVVGDVFKGHSNRKAFLKIVVRSSKDIRMIKVFIFIIIIVYNLFLIIPIVFFVSLLSISHHHLLPSMMI